MDRGWVNDRSETVLHILQYGNGESTWKDVKQQQSLVPDNKGKPSRSVTRLSPPWTISDHVSVTKAVNRACRMMSSRVTILQKGQEYLISFIQGI